MVYSAPRLQCVFMPVLTRRYSKAFLKVLRFNGHLVRPNAGVENTPTGVVWCGVAWYCVAGGNGECFPVFSSVLQVPFCEINDRKVMVCLLT